MSARWLRYLMVLALAPLLLPGTPASADRTAYPTVVVTLGTMGAKVSHHDGWYRGDQPPSVFSGELTSWCKKGGTPHPRAPHETRPTWGVLTHPQGFEIVEGGGYGEHQYMMYDPVNEWLRPANVDRYGYLVPAQRIDQCSQ